MPSKIDPDTTPGMKLLRLFRKLMMDGRRHFQSDLAEEFQCSSQTIIRIIAEIEAVVGASLETGLENRRRWYQIRAISRSRLGLDFEEIRYLSLCRDMAATLLPKQITERLDKTIFELSLLMADQHYADRGKAQERQLVFYPKGKINYEPFYDILEKLVVAKEKTLVCLVRYKALGKNQDKEHRYLPGHIVGMGGALYCLGGTVSVDFATSVKSMVLAIHRIKDVTLTDRVLHCPLPEADSTSFGLPWHEPRLFTIRFSPNVADYIRERVWSDSQSSMDTDDGGVELTIATKSTPELMAWIRSFGENAVIVSL